MKYQVTIAYRGQNDQDNIEFEKIVAAKNENEAVAMTEQIIFDAHPETRQMLAWFWACSKIKS